MKLFFKKNTIFFIFILMLILSTIFNGKCFLQKGNLLNICRQASIIGVLAIGEALVIITGGIDLSLGSLVALSSVMYATFMSPYGILFSVVLTILICTFLGSINGFLVAKAKMPPFIVTLGMMLIGRGLATLIAKGDVVYGIKKSFSIIAQGEIGGLFPIPLIILLILAIITHIFLTSTVLGRQIYAVGGSKQSAQLSGVNVEKILFLVYLLAGLFASLSGLIYTARLTAGYCEGAVGFELDAIASAIIGGVSLLGGKGNLFKVIIGAFILTLITNFLNLRGLSPYIQEAIKGVIILGAIYLSMKGSKLTVG